MPAPIVIRGPAVLTSQQHCLTPISRAGSALFVGLALHREQDVHLPLLQGLPSWTIPRSFWLQDMGYAALFRGRAGARIHDGIGNDMTTRWMRYAMSHVEGRPDPEDI